jgi:hypothetical protein
MPISPRSILRALTVLRPARRRRPIVMSISGRRSRRERLIRALISR